jgi:hypothetical protein
VYFFLSNAPLIGFSFWRAYMYNKIRDRKLQARGGGRLAGGGRLIVCSRAHTLTDKSERRVLFPFIHKERDGIMPGVSLQMPIAIGQSRYEIASLLQILLNLRTSRCDTRHTPKAKGPNRWLIENLCQSWEPGCSIGGDKRECVFSFV